MSDLEKRQSNRGSPTPDSKGPTEKQETTMKTSMALGAAVALAAASPAMAGHGGGGGGGFHGGGGGFHGGADLLYASAARICAGASLSASRLRAPRLPTSGLRARLCVSSAAECAAASERSTTRVLSAAISLRLRHGRTRASGRHSGGGADGGLPIAWRARCRKLPGPKRDEAGVRRRGHSDPACPSRPHAGDARRRDRRVNREGQAKSMQIGCAGL